MYVRLITYYLKPSVTSEQAAPVYDEMLELMQELGGFRGLSLLMNEEAHQAVSLSYWDDQVSARDAGPLILPHLMGQLQELVEQPPDISGFDLARQDMP